MNVLVLATGSISIKLLPKLLEQLSKEGHTVKYTTTEMGYNLWNALDTHDPEFGIPATHGSVANDEIDTYLVTGKVVHVELAQWADVILVCPATANTIAKMCSGISDNIVTDILLVASGLKKRIVVAPAMNTSMLKSWNTERNIKTLFDNGVEIVCPSVKQLACGDYGFGALADLKAIVNIVNGHKWTSPLAFKTYLPINPHPGSFGAIRKFDIHKGVDLYCEEGDNVYAVEDGSIVCYGTFTGPKADCPWWNETGFILVNGKSGYVIYGEVDLGIIKSLNCDNIVQGQLIATVKAVLPPEKKRPDIPGHSNAMLHMELLSEYVDPTRKASDWELNQPRPKWLLDPTPYLMLAKRR